MQRGKDDGKIVGPMFPRLHVNDTEKGGPRAPPRNKMALYEQLSVTSQRFNKPNNTSNAIPTASSSQGTGQERNFLFQPHHSPSTPTYQVEKFHTRPSSRASLNSALSQPEQRKKVGEEDDFTVPVLFQSRVDLCKPQNGISREKTTSPNQDFRDNPGSRFCKLRDSDACLQQTSRAGLQPENGGCRDGVVETTRELPRSESLSRENHSNSNKIDDDDGGGCVDRACSTVQMGQEDKSDDVSETSMVVSDSGLDIAPDDVVGIIGQKHFWKARRAIVNQQRVFAVQVFELHRLIKVQQSIAASPNILLENDAFLGTSPKPSPAKKRSSEYIVKPRAHFNIKVNSQEPNNKAEHSAENAVGKTALSSARNDFQPSTHTPYMVNPLPPPSKTDTKMGNWYFHQSPGHQWLVPVISPSEGLVYKPYPAPGFMGTVYGGGCGPRGSIIDPAYGVPGSHHQGIGVLPGTPQMGHTYLPPYSMFVMNPAMSGSNEQANRNVGPGSNDQMAPLSGGVFATSNMQHEKGSCNAPTLRNGDVSQVVRFQALKESELQASTASSPRIKVPVSQGRDVLPLFPMSPVVSEEGPSAHDIVRPKGVIRVVPHNSRSATESAARIFKSIQEERKQHDSV